MSSARKFDLLIFGASGFTGRLASLYVAKQYGSSIKWALAGRSKDKLTKLKSECSDFPEVVIADSNDEDALEKMVGQTEVVVSFAGPFARYGSSLVAACVKAGVDYCDITGEVDWLREMIVKHDDAAKASGARVVSLCGLESMPYDLMTLMLVKRLREKKSDAELALVEFWDDIQIQPSGGTMETLLGIMFGAEKNKQIAGEVSALGYDPLLKVSAGEAGSSNMTLNPQNVRFLEFADASKLHSSVRTTIFMADINASALTRSNAINKYGSRVIYREGRSFSGILEAVGNLIRMTVLEISLAIPPLRYFMQKFDFPKPEERPSEDTMAKGYLHMIGVATSTDGSTAKASMRFAVDPRYKETARMAVEAGLSLSLDGEKLNNKDGGVFTPAACQGEVLLERLLKTGTSFEFH